MTVKLTINGKSIEAQTGTTVLEVARQHGIVIPTLCYHQDLSPVGSCRLCVVEVEGWRGQVASCTLEVSEGMNVFTETPSIVNSRRMILELLLSNYYDAGYKETPDNEFMRWVTEYQVELPAEWRKKARFQIDSDPNPFVWVDFNKCILCTRCVRACAEIQGRFVWGVAERGHQTRIIAGMDTNMLEARCESCGACVAYCPTGALDNRMLMKYGKPDKVVTTTCAYCGVGCQFDLNVKDGKVIGVTSNPNAPVNGMHLCVKGRYGYDYIHHPDRLTRPMVREYLLQNQDRKGTNRGEWVEVDWDTALDITAKKITQIRNTYGPDSIGVLTSAKCLNEENYLMNKLARQVIGTNNIDHCARLCHSSTVAGLATTFGSGAMSNSMDDVIDCSAAIFVIGSNTTEQHPVFGTKIRQAVLKRKVKLIVADPRQIDLTEFATLHLRHKPGTDIALLNGIMYIILENGWEDKEFIQTRTEGFEQFKQTVMLYPPEVASTITGVPIEHFYQAAELMAMNKPMAVVWAMGITQHIVGVRNVMSLSNLQMLLGNMGIPGGGVNPLRGQNNVQGACDMGGLPNVYPGYQPVDQENVRRKFEEAWGTTLPANIGMAVTEIIPAAENGKIKALYILGEDPVMSDPDSNHVRRCLDACEFIVLQEIFPSETSVYADVLLPGVSFAEKTGTFTNTERRIQLCRQAIQPLGEARPDWQIIADVAKRLLSMGERPIRSAPYSGWDYSDTAQIMAEIAALTPSYAGVTHERLQKGERLQWPVKSLDHPGTPILHIGQFTRGLGKFMPIEHIPPAELTDYEYPMLLTTGRVIYHWHGGELTRRSKGLLDIYPQSLIEINPEDAAKLGLNGSNVVRIVSRRGEVIARAVITDRVTPGMIFANFHFPGDQNANNLTIAALDPIAKIPEYKVCAVKIEKID
jgi:formate dehydrogenase alpha subunit